ncbi:MAG: ABC transporter, partial [Clostridia bacterium]|nr:ABC transporter [Clostridia bacterium]
YVSVNVFAFIYALLGMMLLGAALISIGMLISSLTESSVVAAILTLVINILALYMANFSSAISISWLSTIAEKAAFISAVQSFGKTIFSIPDIVYFLSITAAFLFLTVRSLEKRRWA